MRAVTILSTLGMLTAAVTASGCRIDISGEDGIRPGSGIGSGRPTPDPFGRAEPWPVPPSGGGVAGCTCPQEYVCQSGGIYRCPVECCDSGRTDCGTWWLRCPDSSLSRSLYDTGCSDGDEFCSWNGHDGSPGTVERCQTEQACADVGVDNGLDIEFCGRFPSQIVPEQFNPFIDTQCWWQVAGETRRCESRGSCADACNLGHDDAEDLCRAALDPVPPDTGPGPVSPSCREIIDSIEIMRVGVACLDRCVDRFVDCLVRSDCRDSGCSEASARCATGCT